MKTRITKLQFGNICGTPIFGWIIKIKKHWWSKWDIRDWDSELNHIPKFYHSEEDAVNHL